MCSENDCCCSYGDFFEYLGRVLPPIAPCGLAAMLLVLLSSSNFWWSSERVLSHLRREEPLAQHILSVERHLFGPPVYAVELSDGTRKAYLLETDVMQRSYFFRR